MINILILEDELIQRKILVELIQKVSKEYKIYQSDTVEEGLRIAQENEISLFYVDINLRDASGLNFAQKIRKISKYRLTWIVFITTHIKYMLEAFKEIHCYDYIMKPYETEQIEELTERLLNEKPVNQGNIIFEREYVAFDVSGIILKIFIDEIILVEVRFRTSIIYTKTEKYELRNTSLIKVKEKIKNPNFVQVHRSYLVNLKSIQSIDKTNSTWMIQCEKYEERIPIGDKFKVDVINKLKGALGV